MADVYEQNLPQKTNLTTNDYVRVVGSDDVSYKQPLSDVAQKTIENYAGSTLAGSTQSVKGAIDGLKSSAIADKAELNASINEVASDLANESSTRASQDTNLQAQINQLVAPTGTAPNPAEIENARIGADNITYTTLGDAIRTQVTDLKSDLDGVQNVTAFAPYLTWEQGGLNDGADSTSNIRIRTKFIAFAKGTEVKFSVLSGYKYAVNFYNASKTWLTEKYWLTADTTFYANFDGYLRVVLGHSNNAGITPSDSSNMMVTVTKPITNDIFAMQSDHKVYQQTNVTDADATASLLWQQGSLSSGVNSDAPDRIRTASYIFVGDINTLKITVSDGYQVAVNKYNADYAYVGEDAFSGGSYSPNIDGISYVRLIARHSPDTTTVITPEVGNTVVSCLFTSNMAVISKQNNALVNNAKSSLKEQVNYWMVAGSITNAGVDSQANSAIRFRTPTPAFTRKGTILALKDTIYGLNNHYFYIFKYDENGTLISNGDPVSWAIIDEDCYVRIMGRKGNNQAIDDTVISEFAHDFIVLDNPQNLYYERTNPFRSIQHSGNYGGAPMNTIAGFKAGYNAGFRIQEFDVRLTSDNVWVCCHNATINATARNSDGSELATDVYVANSTYTDLLQYDFGIYAGSQYAGTKIPTVEEALTFLKSVGSMAYIDIMTYPEATEEQVQNLMDIVINCGMIGNSYFLASGANGGMNYSYWITNYKKNANIVFTGTAGRYIQDAIVSLTGQNAVCLDMRCDLADSTQIGNAKTYGIPVEVYDVSTTAEMDALDGYITGVSSDNIVASEYLRNKALS